MEHADPTGSPLLQAWVPTLEVAERRLRRGARVGEVGVAAASAAIALAFAYPASTFHGFDPDADTVASLRDAIARAGLSDRVTYEVGTLRGSGYDVVRLSTGARVDRAVLRAGGVAIEHGPRGVNVRPRPPLIPAC